MEPSGLHALRGGLNASTEKQVWDVALEWDLSLQRGNRKLCQTCWGTAPLLPANCEPLACSQSSLLSRRLTRWCPGSADYHPSRQQWDLRQSFGDGRWVGPGWTRPPAVSGTMECSLGLFLPLGVEAQSYRHKV